MRDLNDRYLRGVGDLLQAIGPTDADYLTVLTLQGRLAQAVSEIRQYGPIDSARVEIARVTTELDRVCSVHLSKSFHSLCGVDDLSQTKPLLIKHNLPQPDHGRFVGREQELAKIYKLLSPTSRHFLVTIDGIGGIGKSALALEVSHHYLYNAASLPEFERFDAIIWTSAKQTTLTSEGIIQRKQILRTLNDIFKAISVTLEHEDITLAEMKDQHDIVCKVLTQHRVLLIVDNLETVDDEMVMGFLRELPAPTKAIVTTRHRLDVAYAIRLTEMPLEDAKVLIAQECEKKRVTLTEEQIHKLYDRTGGVPLAMVWSVAQIGVGYGVDSVLTRLGNPGGDIARFCFEAAMERIRGTDAHKLLMALALIATDVNREMLGLVTGLGEDIMSCDNGLAELEKLSFINNQTGLFSMLPLTQAYVNDELRKNRKFVEAAIQRWIPLWFKRNPQFYIERPADRRVYREFLQGGTVLIQGMRQTGKSSLLGHALEFAKSSGALVLRIDLALFQEKVFGSLDTFLYSLAEAIVDQLEIRTPLESFWDKTMLGSPIKLTSFVEEIVLSGFEQSIVLALDSVDRVAQFRFGDSFFGLIRSWHNIRAFKEHWKRLTIVMAHVSEPYLLINDHAQSPFNIGVRVNLDDFNDEQVAELNDRYGSPLRTSEELKKLQELVGGHPYLLQTAFYTIVIREQSLDDLSATALSLDGPFGVHLTECENLLSKPELRRAFTKVISDNFGPDETTTQKLRSLGFILSNTQARKVLPRCGLYSSYFGKKQMPANFFWAGGTLVPTTPSYLERDADTLLLESVQRGNFCYILEPRQTGKTSLIIHCAQQMNSIGYEPIVIDLTRIGISATPEQFFFSILLEIGQRYIEGNLEDWWEADQQQSMHKKLAGFMERKLLIDAHKRFVLLFDEIDIGLNNPHILDELFRFIRLCYAQRSIAPQFKNLDFVVLGVADPAEIFAGENHVLRESCSRIEVRDFSRKEIQPLSRGFGLDLDSAKSGLDRIYWWTNGHPYLTQRLCLAISDLPELSSENVLEKIDFTVQKLFLEETGRHEPNLLFVTHRLLKGSHGNDALELYKHILLGRQIRFDDRLPTHRYLRIVGIVKVVNGVFEVRNRVYKTVFNEEWVKENLLPRFKWLSWLGFSKQ